MSTTAVEVVAYGRPATEALAARVAGAQSGHPLDPVTVVVPSNIAGLSARRLLVGGLLGGSGLANVNFVTPLRLAEIVGSAQLSSRQPLTNPVLAAAVRSVLAEQPGMFARVADHQAAQAAVVALYSELSRALPETLSRIAGASRRGGEVVRLVLAACDRLVGYYDEDGLARAATARIRDDPSVAASLGTVVWHLPDRLSPAMAALLRQVLGATSSVVIAGLTGDADADAAVRQTAAAAGIVLPAHEPVVIVRCEQVLSVSDPDEEARAVVREVMARAEAGMALDRMAIFHPIPDPYARTLLEHLDGAGIPHNGPATVRLADSAAGRTLLALLSLPALGWGRSDVIALVAGAPLRDGDRPVAPSRWDAVSRAAGVVAGLDDWSTKLAALAAHLRAERERRQVAGEASEAQLRALLAEAEAADGLLSFVERLAANLDQLQRCRTWADRSTSARALIERLLGAEHLRHGWPEHETAAAQHVDAALARLAALDEVEPAPSAGSFELAVTAELEVRPGRVGTFGHGVLVAPLTAALGLDLDAVFVLGMAEGTCPSFRREDALLPDDDRARAVAGELIDRQDRLRDQHRSLLAALAAGGVSRTLVFPRGDLRSRRSRLASRWLLQSVSDLAERRVFSSEMDGLGPPLVEKIASYAAGVATAAVHGSLVDRDVAMLLAHVEAGGDPALHPLVSGSLQRGYRCNRGRGGTAFTEWDGNLAGQELPSPAGGMAISPSRLEAWAGCPFSYFLAHVLRLGEQEDPEQIVQIGARDRGSLVHEVLEHFMAEAIARPTGPPAPDERWTVTDRDRMRALAEETFSRYHAEGRTGRPLTWQRTRADILADLDTFLDHDDVHRSRQRVRLSQVEMAFGLGGEPPFVIGLPGGRDLKVRGVVDRVDAAEDGRLFVLDYKTGKDRDGAELEADPVRAGKTLQLGVYAEAVRARLGGHTVDARYWMATSNGGFKQRGYLWDERRRERFLGVVETIVEGIEGGTFPAQPGVYESFFGSHANCRTCEFDRVCPRNRDDHQQAKADAPELTLLDRLQPPEAETEDG